MGEVKTKGRGRKSLPFSETTAYHVPRLGFTHGDASLVAPSEYFVHFFKWKSYFFPLWHTLRGQQLSSPHTPLLSFTPLPFAQSQTVPVHRWHL